MDRNNEDFSVAKFSRARFAYNGLNRAPNPVVHNDEFKFKLPVENRHDVFAAASRIGVSFSVGLTS